MQPGSLVECIRSFTESKKFGFKVPVVGNIYTVRSIDPFQHLNGAVGIFLEEIINDLYQFTNGNLEPSWHIGAFREIQPPMDINIDEIIKETV